MVKIFLIKTVNKIKIFVCVVILKGKITLNNYNDGTPLQESVLHPPFYTKLSVSLEIYVTDEDNYNPYVSQWAETNSNTTNEETEDTSSTNESEEETDETDETSIDYHLGQIKETRTYNNIQSCEFNEDYDGLTGEGKVTMRFYKEDLKYIYKGVRGCLIIERKDIKGKVLSDVHFKFFITNVQITNSDIFELTLSSYTGALLQEKNKLTFNNLLRSQILEEVLKTAGIVPYVNAYGMKDEQISWTSSSNSKDDSNDSVDLDPSTKFNDCTDTYSMCCDSGKDGSQSSGHVVANPESKTEYLKTIGKKGTNYANYVSGCTDAKQVMQKLRQKMRYRQYNDNAFKCASQSFDGMTSPGINCGDSARLVKACMDVCGIPCLIIHGTAHYYNNVKYNGKWYTTDLCFASRMGQSGSTNTLNDGNGHGATGYA